MSDQIDVAYYHQLALQKQEDHRKFLDGLKKRPPKNLDKLVKETHEAVFQRIDCTKCANCCKSLGPNLTEADIKRMSKLFRLKLSTFEQTYLRVDEDGDKVFQSMPCPFLGADKLCDVYDARPKACAEFPHTDRKKFYQINHLTLKNTLICPAAYEFVEALRGKL
ncbi:YkgJ family cysteine cluster protein [Streptococcus pluranimalium]